MLVEIWPGYWVAAEEVRVVSPVMSIPGFEYKTADVWWRRRETIVSPGVPPMVGVSFRDGNWNSRPCATDDEARQEATRIAKLVNEALGAPHGDE